MVMNKMEILLYLVTLKHRFDKGGSLEQSVRHIKSVVRHFIVFGLLVGRHADLGIAAYERI